MKVLAKIFLMVILGISFVAPTYAQEVLWDELNQEVVKLYKDGQYSEAAKVAEEALKVAEETFGPDHPDAATVLENMAGFYKKIGKKDEAKRLKERAKRIRERNQ